MEKDPCPSCGAELNFQSSQSIFMVCPYCSSSVVRQDLELKDLGKMASLPEDISPIQVGMTGHYRTLFFYVSGRVIYEWENGFWNEWHLYFDNGETGWLSEAQGEFAISRPLEAKLSPAESELFLGKTYAVKNEKYCLSDIKEVTYKGSQGELPFKALVGYRANVYDFSHAGAKFLSLEFSHDKEDKFLAYVGEYVEFLNLKPQNIRLIEGWSL